MDIEQQLADIRAHHNVIIRREMAAKAAAINSAETDYYQAKYPDAGLIELVSITEPSRGLIVTVKGATYRLNWKSDQDLNGTFIWGTDPPPARVVPIFADKIARHERRLEAYEKHGYRFRVTQGFLIDLVQRYHDQYNAQDMISLLELGDALPVEQNNRRRQGFRAWLLTRSYVCDDRGALWACLRDWKYRRAFEALVKGDS